MTAARTGDPGPPTLIARCVHGLEWIAADEIVERLPGADGVTLSRREITFRLPTPSPDLLALRTVDDVFLRIGQVGGVGTAKDVPAALAGRLAGMPWAARLDLIRAVRPVPDTALFDVVASVEGRRAFNRYAVEHAVGELLARLLRGSYLARSPTGRAPGDPDLTVRIFIRDEVAVAALRVGSGPLHRRGYKLDTGPGTLHPPVAAALARLADPRSEAVVLDPFCGDGTIAVETALAYPHSRINAGDIDPLRVRHAAGNATRAGVHVTLSAVDALHAAIADPVDALVTNPPWNLAVDAGGELAHSLDPFWRRVPAILRPGGRLVAVSDADLDVPAALGRAGCTVALATRVRLAGRVSQVVLAGPGGGAPRLPHGAARWREHAVARGVVTATGF